jgi:hypothetical protein
MSSNPIRRAIAVLDLSRKAGDVIAYAQSVANALKGNPSLPAPTPTLTVFDADVAALQAAEAVAVSREKGAVQERNAKLAVVKTDLEYLRAYVQSVADANLTNAPAIIESAGMGVKKVPARDKAPLAIKPGLVAGSVEIVAKAVSHRASYDWEYSADGKTWIVLPSTLQSRTTLSGLTRFATYSFQFRAVTKTGVGDWETPISYTVL